MGVQKKERKIKRIISSRDSRLKKNQDKGEIEAKKKAKGDEIIREMYVHKQGRSVVIWLTLFQPSSLICHVLPV
jgi:hypothetical protein